METSFRSRFFALTSITGERYILCEEDQILELERTRQKNMPAPSSFLLAGGSSGLKSHLESSAGMIISRFRKYTTWSRRAEISRRGDYGDLAVKKTEFCLSHD